MGKYTQKSLGAVTSDLEPGEQLIVAVPVTPRGAIKKQAIGGALGGAVGSAVAHRSSTKNSGTGLVISKNVVLGVTNQRVLVWGVSVLTGKPKDLIDSVSRGEIVQVTANNARVVGMKSLEIDIEFSNGTVTKVDVPALRIKEGEEFVQQFT